MSSVQRSEVEIGEQHQALAEVLVLLLDRLLDLDDHLGEPPDVVGGADDLRAGGLVLVVGHRRQRAGVVLHQHLMSCLDQRFYACRGYAYAALVVLYFLGYANNHSFSPPSNGRFRL